MTREQFLDKYLTVVTKKDAVKEQDDKAKAFVKKYLTQVGCPAAEPGPEPTKYAVTFKKGSGEGKCVSDKERYAEGEEVVLTVTPVSGALKELYGEYGYDEDYHKITIDPEDPKFEMPTSDVIVYYSFKE